MSLPVKIKLAAEELLAELESNSLQVMLVPTRYRMNEGGCVRVAVSKNATWYRRFCALYASGRKRNNRAFDTKIKRLATIRALERFAQGASPRGVYGERLQPIVARHAQTLIPATL
jgi:hypothetical protein